MRTGKSVCCRGATAALLAWLALAFPNVDAGGQQPGVSGVTPDSAPRSTIGALAGTVTDRTGIPVAYATVFLPDGSASALADEYGNFHLGNLPAAMTTVGIRRIGYSPVYFDIELSPGNTVHIEARLTPIVTRIREVVILDEPLSESLRRGGFYERMQRYNGTFITPAELEQRKPSQVTQVLRGISGITIMQDPNGRDYTVYGRGPASHCALQIFLDGVAVQGNLDGLIPISSVKAIEVYARRSTTPPQFLKSDTQCGAIAFWTRID